MVKNNQEDLSRYITKQTLAFAVVISLFAGFVGGTIYSSFKLAADGSASQPSVNNSDNGSAQNTQGPSAQVAAQIFALEQKLEKNPKDTESWTNIGHLFFDSNQYENAIEAYTKSLELQPENLGVITDLGVMYRRNKQPEKAIEMFDKVISLDPGFETARFNKGIVLMHDLNDFAGGIQAWEELLNVNPMAKTPGGEPLDSIIRKMKQKK